MKAFHRAEREACFQNQASKDKIVCKILESLLFFEISVVEQPHDVGYLLKIGYKTLMLGDDICLSRDSVISALNVLEAIVENARAI